MPKYNVWRSYMEQWDKDNLDPPDMVLEARNPSEAAIKFADAKHLPEYEAAVIVQEEGSSQYFEIELAKSWEVDLYSPTTLEKLCEP